MKKIFVLLMFGLAIHFTGCKTGNEGLGTIIPSGLRCEVVD